MIIHVVKPGEYLSLIAKKYGVSVYTIVSDNQIEDPNRLAIGQALVIMQPARKHTVTSGQSFHTISKTYGITINELIAANPQVANPALIHPGMVLNIPEKSSKLGTIDVNGFAFPSIDMDILRRTLPNLTYLSIFSKPVNPDGTLSQINDVPLIQAAKAFRVAPIMVISNIAKTGGFSSDLAHTILTSDTAINNLIGNVRSELKEKNYYGLDIDFEYVYPADRERYNSFLTRITGALKPLGYTISTALAPKVGADQVGILYEAHDYPVHGRLANHVILMTYEWGFTYGPPMAVAPLNSVRKVLEYAVTEIPREKILMGIPNYGYDWTLPYVQGTTARTLSNAAAANFASSIGARIKFDASAMSPFYNYSDSSGKQHVVWFEDARSIDAKLRLAHEFALGGVSYWTIGRYFSQNWLILQSLFNVRKVL